MCGIVNPCQISWCRNACIVTKVLKFFFCRTVSDWVFLTLLSHYEISLFQYVCCVCAFAYLICSRVLWKVHISNDNNMNWCLFRIKYSECQKTQPLNAKNKDKIQCTINLGTYSSKIIIFNFYIFIVKMNEWLVYINWNEMWFLFCNDPNMLALWNDSMITMWFFDICKMVSNK